MLFISDRGSTDVHHDDYVLLLGTVVMSKSPSKPCRTLMGMLHSHGHKPKSMQVRCQVHAGEFFELPGRPHVCWCLRHYGDDSFSSAAQGAESARQDFAFLFKAFEAGQIPPHRLKKDAGSEYVPTIHQYLDWTITASSPSVRPWAAAATSTARQSCTELSPSEHSRSDALSTCPNLRCLHLVEPSEETLARMRCALPAAEQLNKRKENRKKSILHCFLQLQDWDDLDFGGFRTVLLFSRHKPEFPPPGHYDTAPPAIEPELGCPLPPKPALMTKMNKPVSVATVRVGDGYLEVPFFATSDNYRGRGYGRCLLECIETVRRCIQVCRL